VLDELQGKKYFRINDLEGFAQNKETQIITFLFECLVNFPM